MSTANMTPLKTANTRVFLIEGRARADHAPVYKSYYRMMGVTQGFGDIERVELPSEDQYGQFEEIGEIQGAIERPTTSLQGKYAQDLASDMLRLGQKRCAFDVQLHVGACQDPRVFDDYDKIIVLEGAKITNYSTDDLGALGSGDNAQVNEQVDISAKKVYEILPMSFAKKAESSLTNEVIDVTICDSVSCGDCTTESDGCYRIYGVTLAAGGSPSTPADFFYSLDKGVTWYFHDIDGMGTSNSPNAIGCLGKYVFVVSNANLSGYYALKSEIDGYTDPTFTAIATGLVASKGPNAISSVGNYAFVVGNGGYVYGTSDITAGFTVLDAGSATVDNLLDVHALSQTFAVAVGNNGAVVYTEDGSTWAAVTQKPVGAAINLNAIWCKSKTEWWVGTSTGRLYYTLNGGVTWTEKAFSGSGSGVVYDIVFPTDSVGFVSHSTSAPRARVLKTNNGGQSWIVMPESGSLPLADRINAFAYCQQDPNFVIGGGLADDASDGYLVIGNA